MSNVYLVLNERANKYWAMKEVRKDGVKDYEIVKQGLIAEINILKRLQHSNLPSIVDIIEMEDTFLIIMDYIKGTPLDQIIEKEGVQSQQDVVKWARQLCDVLSYLHNQIPSIIYRDMKPSNIMLKPDGNIMLIDFGTAREFSEGKLVDTTYLGTIGYAPPEQFGGVGQTDKRTDIYSLGATLYYLITGHNPCMPPYEIKPIREINNSLSNGLEKIIIKCTAKNPEDRYQNCNELIYALEHYNEIDDVYLRKQKRRLILFFSSVIVCIFSLTCGVIFNYAAERLKESYYDYIIKTGKKEVNYNEKVSIYKNAIAIKPENKDGYIQLIESYKEDGYFTEAEEEELLTIWEWHAGNIYKHSKEIYAEICYEVGILYWYYYTYGQTDNRMSQMILAITWFEDSLENSNHNLAMAESYSELGKFHMNITRQMNEDNDSGMYKDYWDRVCLLIQSEEISISNEIVQCECYRMAAYMIEGYTQKLKNDGVTMEELTEMNQLIKNSLKKMNTTYGTKAAAIKENLLYRSSYIDEIISIAYSQK